MQGALTLGFAMHLVNLFFCLNFLIFIHFCSNCGGIIFIVFIFRPHGIAMPKGLPLWFFFLSFSSFLDA